MILLPTEQDMQPFLTRCLLRGDVRDVRKMNAAVDDDEIEAERRAYLRDAKRRERDRKRNP